MSNMAIIIGSILSTEVNGLDLHNRESSFGYGIFNTVGRKTDHNSGVQSTRWRISILTLNLGLSSIFSS